MMLSEDSRLACSDFTASKKNVIEAMTKNYYEEEAFPNYENFGVIMGSRGGKKKSRKNQR